MVNARRSDSKPDKISLLGQTSPPKYLILLAYAKGSILFSLPLSLFLALSLSLYLDRTMPATCLPLHTPTPLMLPTRNSSNRTKYNHCPAPRKRLVGCRAAPSSSSVTDFDLYELLGVDSTSNQSQIKLAYRSLQKRCHPDIAGPTGHDMSIILNDAYALLSDPNSRLAYDKASITPLLLNL